MSENTISPTAELSLSSPTPIRLRRLVHCCAILTVLLTSSCFRSPLPLLQPMGPMPEKPMQRIAVLPFANESEYLSGGIVAFRIFSAEMSSMTDYDLVQEGDVRTVFQQLSIYPGQAPNFEQLRIVARKLDIQLLIQGTVLQMSDGKNKGQGGTPLFGVNLRFVEAESGRTIWTTYHRRQGTDYCKVMHFGCINTLTGLTRQSIREVIQLWQENGL